MGAVDQLELPKQILRRSHVRLEHLTDQEGDLDLVFDDQPCHDQNEEEPCECGKRWSWTCLLRGDPILRGRPMSDRWSVPQQCSENCGCFFARNPWMKKLQQVTFQLLVALRPGPVNWQSRDLDPSLEGAQCLGVGFLGRGATVAPRQHLKWNTHENHACIRWLNWIVPRWTPKSNIVGLGFACDVLHSVSLSESNAKPGDRVQRSQLLFPHPVGQLARRSDLWLSTLCLVSLRPCHVIKSEGSGKYCYCDRNSLTKI